MGEKHAEGLNRTGMGPVEDRRRSLWPRLGGPWGRRVVALRPLGRLLAVLILVPALCGLGPVLERSPVFAVREILVEGCESMDPEAVRALLREEEGTSLLTLNSARVSRKLEAHVPIRHASVIKRFPHGLLVRIRERTPVALVDIQGTLFALDNQGVVLYPAPPGDPLDLPVITGLSDRAWVLGRPDKGPTVQGALSLLRAARRSGLPARVTEIRADPQEGMSFFLEGCPAEIRVGWEAFPARLVLLARALPALARDANRSAFVDLRFHDQIIVGTRGSAHERMAPKGPAAERGTGVPRVGKQGTASPRG